MARIALQPKLSMRAEARQFENIHAAFFVDQNQIGANVAVAMVLPLPRQLMIDIARRQWLVRRQQADGALQQRIELVAQHA